MNGKVLFGTAGLAGAAIMIGQMDVGASTDAREVNPVSDSGVQVEQTGSNPDVITFKISGLSNWSDATYRAYSVGTTSCNIGNANLSWTNGGTSNQHPVIHQSMYRYKLDAKGNGRFEQIAQGWLKHGFCALDLTECGDCQGTGCSSLGVNCSDPYTSGRNGSQGNAGPKWQVNASTGFFPMPPANPGWSGQTARRMRALRSDVEAASNPGAQYYAEAQYVHPQDSPEDAGNAGNNASYRRLVLSSTGQATGYNGDTVQKVPAINAWKAIDPEVSIVVKKITGLGTVRVAYRVYDNGDGTWDYEYAIHNLDLDDSVGGFTLPVPSGVDVTEVGFHDVHYHSGDGIGSTNFSSADWADARGSDDLSWTTQPFASNANANAIRWGTTYNFRYTADSGPVDAPATFTTFKTETDYTVSVAVPEGGPTLFCDEDVDEDGEVGFSDLLAVLTTWGPCPGCPEDVDGDDVVGFSDVLAIFGVWGPCTP